MKSKYSDYSVKDFLNDHFFMTSILNQTSDTTMYWESILKEDKELRKNFEEAKQILLDDQPKLNDADTEKLSKDLWAKIYRTNKQKKRISLVKEISKVAVIIVLFIGLSVSYIIYNSNDFNDSRIVADNITVKVKDDALFKQGVFLKTNDSLISIPDSENIDIRYSNNGNLEINKKDFKLRNLPRSKFSNLTYNELVVPYGKRTTLTLSDGSKLHVNSGTRIRYPMKFSDRRRDIYVDGEIFIDVAKDKEKPFYVHTHAYTTEVLGTSFNVSAYSEDKSASILLISGKVKVFNENNEYVLKPNQMLEFIDSRNILSEENDINNHTSWKEGVYRFQNESMDNILIRLAKYYGVSMTYPATAKQLRFSGSLDLKDDFKRTLYGICAIANLDYIEENESQYKIIIKN